jgi:hypothetical protein
VTLAGNSLRKNVRSSGDMLFSSAATSSCPITSARCECWGMYSNTDAAKRRGRIRNAMTCSSSSRGRRRIVVLVCARTSPGSAARAATHSRCTSEGRHCGRKPLQTISKILTESCQLDFGFEAPIRGGDDTHIGMPFASLTYLLARHTMRPEPTARSLETPSVRPSKKDRRMEGPFMQMPGRALPACRKTPARSWADRENTSRCVGLRAAYRLQCGPPRLGLTV